MIVLLSSDAFLSGLAQSLNRARSTLHLHARLVDDLKLDDIELLQVAMFVNQLLLGRPQSVGFEWRSATLGDVYACYIQEAVVHGVR